MLEKIKEWWSQGTDWVIKAGIIFIVLLIVAVLLANYTSLFDRWNGYVDPHPVYHVDTTLTQISQWTK